MDTIEVWARKNGNDQQIGYKKVQGEIGDLQEFVDSKMMIFGDYQYMFSDNTAFTDVDMAMEKGGYFIGVEYKNTNTLTSKTIPYGQFLFAKNIALAGGNIFYFFVHGTPENPEKYFVLKSVKTPEKYVLEPIQDLKNGKKEFQEILKNEIEWIKENSLLSNKSNMFAEAKSEIENLFCEYYKIK